MKILTRREQDRLMDIFGIIKVAMLDYENDPIGTMKVVNRAINEQLVPTIGGKKGVERCAKKVSDLLEGFAQKGLMDGLECDEKV